MNKVMPVALLPIQLAELDRDYVQKNLRSIALHRRVVRTINARIRFLNTLPEHYTWAVPSTFITEFKDYDAGSKESDKKIIRLHRASTSVMKTLIKLEADTDRYIKEWAKASCRALCDDVQHKLPRELRDNIYKSIIADPVSWEFEISKGYCHKVEAEVGSIELLNSQMATNYSHLAGNDYISMETMYEFAEIWYCVVDFVSHDSMRYLLEFFKHDLWGFNLPISQHLRKLELCGWIRYYENESDVLQCLLALNRQTRITFNFNCGQARVWSVLKDHVGFVVNEARQLFPLIEELLDAGFKLSAQIKSIKWEVTKEALSFEDWIRIVDGKSS